MATQADGEGRFSLKEQEALLICIRGLVTRVTSLLGPPPPAVLFYLTRKKGGSALEKRRGGDPVAMAARGICLCAVHTPALLNTARKLVLFTPAQICRVGTKAFFGEDVVKI